MKQIVKLGDLVEVRNYSSDWRLAKVVSMFAEGVHVKFMRSDAEIEAEEGTIPRRSGSGVIYQPFGSEDWRSVEPSEHLLTKVAAPDSQT